MSDSNIPMSPEALPQQRLHLVVDLPPRPVGFDVIHVEVDGNPPGCHSWRLEEAALPPRFPSRATYLLQAEWASSPMHNWINAYYISSNKQHTHWFLWGRDSCIPLDTSRQEEDTAPSSSPN